MAKFVNSRGQRTTIYRPILDAIAGKGLSRRKAHAAVRAILVANGNSPKPTTVEYFLQNTLEYVAQQSARNVSTDATQT